MSSKLELLPTTALRKISGLKKRVWAIGGGQGASKTYSILQILINHASCNENKEIYICSHELSKMKRTVIKDFVKIMKSFNLFDSENWINGTTYRFPNGSVVECIGLDKEDIGKGLRADVVYINEANKVKWETYQELQSRAKRVIIDYNPNREFWAHTEVITQDDCDFLNLTFLDNEFLSHEERTQILNYKKKGYDIHGNIINQYWANRWRVYGLGQIGRIEGAIFENFEEGEFDDSLPFGYGLDFGVKDPDAMVKVAVDQANKNIYISEEIYQNGLSTSELSGIIKTIVPKKTLIVADSAANRTILDLERHGVNIKAVKKNRIIDDIRLLQDYQLIVTKESKNLIIELSNYVWLDKKGEIPSEVNNHLIDALRYIAQTIITPIKAKSSRLANARR